MFLITYERIVASGFDDLKMNYIVGSMILNDTLLRVLSSLGFSSQGLGIFANIFPKYKRRFR